MDRDTAGALVIWHDITPEAETLVTEWYNREHQLERVRIPGFLSARRYMALSGSPKLFNLYRVREPSVLESQPYLDCVNHPSETSRRAIPHCIGMIRTVCGYLFHSGVGEGAIAATWRFSAAAEREGELIEWLRERALPAALREVGIASASLLKADAAISGRSSSERTLRPDQREPADLIAVVTGTDPDALRQVAGGVMREAEWRAHGATPTPVFGLYRLAFAI